MRVPALCSSGGFSLIETLLASAILAGAIAGLAQLVALGAQQTVGARDQAAALVLAQSKLEELRADPAIVPSPLEALVREYDGFFDRPDGAYLRRWSIAAFEESATDTLILQVCVSPAGHEMLTHPAGACVSSIRTRRP